jgi:hypothetical protein
MLELQNIVLNRLESGDVNLHSYFNGKSNPIEDAELANELYELVKTLDKEYENVKTVILQLSEDQHMDEPRILISIDEEITFLKLSVLESDNQKFYKNLTDFQEKLVNYIESAETNS